MRISIQTLGTRGDVQPYLALARELISRGHDVQLAGPEQFAGLASSANVPFASLPGEFLALLDTPEGKAAVAGGRGFSAGFKLLKYVRPLMRQLLDSEWRAVRQFSPELMLYHPKSISALHIAKRLDVPAIIASPLPGFTPTAAFPTPMLPVRNLGPLNRASHMLATHSAALLFGRLIGRWRHEALGLKGRRSASKPVGTVYAYSPSVLPKPVDWDDTVLVSGYWFLDESTQWQMPTPLCDFLNKGEKPIYVGFGSMPGTDPVTLAQMVIEGLARAGARGILATGNGALSVQNVPGYIHVIASAPHNQLFKLVSGALHHGGAGTTGESLRAGLPTLVCPFFGDQPFWARRIHELGVGPPPLDRRHLSPDKLAAAFATTRDAETVRRAAAMGRLIANEKGVSRAADFVEQCAIATRVVAV